MHDTRTTSDSSIVSSDGPRNDIPSTAADIDPHAELKAAFIEALPRMLKGLPNGQQGYAREALDSTFERALADIKAVQPEEIDGTLRSLETYLRATIKEHVNPDHVAIQGLALGVLEGFADGKGFVQFPLRGRIAIEAESRVTAEYSGDSLLFRPAVHRPPPTVGQLIVLKADPTEGVSKVSQWATAADYTKPQLPRLSTTQEYAAEAQFLFPNMVFHSSGDLTRRLPVDSMALQTDMGNVISAAMDRVAVSHSKSHQLDALRVDFDTGVRYLQRVLVAKDTFMLSAISPARNAVVQSGIAAQEYVQALCRAMTQSIPGYGVFDPNEVRELSTAFAHLNRAGHLLLHVMGIDSRTMDALS